MPYCLLTMALCDKKPKMYLNFWVETFERAPAKHKILTDDKTRFNCKCASAETTQRHQLINTFIFLQHWHSCINSELSTLNILTILVQKTTTLTLQRQSVTLILSNQKAKITLWVCIICKMCCTIWPVLGLGWSWIKVQVRVRVRVRIRIRFRVRFRSEICTLCIHDFEIGEHILQIAQTDKLHTTIAQYVQ